MSNVVTKMEMAPPATLSAWADSDLCSTKVSDTVVANMPNVVRSRTRR